MGNRPAYVNGFLKMTRLGPPKVVKQKDNPRAPEKFGMWAFPWPYFDGYFVYHRYLNLLPRELKGVFPKDAKWYTTLDGVPIESLDDYSSDDGYYPDLRIRDEWHYARDAWIENIGKKIEKRRSFWYSGPIYTHICLDLEIEYGLDDDLRSEWVYTDTEELHRRIIKSTGDRVKDPHSLGAKYSHDHLEVFIPRGGKIRSNPR